MAGTSAELWKGPNPGVRRYSSADLLHWKIEGLLIDRGRLSPDVWYYDRFWAPEVHTFDDRYCVAFNSGMRRRTCGTDAESRWRTTCPFPTPY